MTTPIKKSVSETGHAKNVANFQSLISFCSGFGAVYNPSKESLKIPQLQSLLQSAQDKINSTITQKTSYDNATNSRRNAFADLKPLSTKITNAFAVSGVEQLGINNLKSMNKKLQGTTSRKASVTAEDSQPDTGKTISTSQQSYDKMVEHFSSIIEILIQNPAYNPNENDLKVTSLQDKLSDMQTKNSELIDAYTQYSNAMLDRNQTLYNPLSGLVQTSKEIKQYVKSIFGASSPQFKQINGIEFKVIKGG
jgi:vacuolar-type H+-ATPase subunit D/Vma8